MPVTFADFKSSAETSIDACNAVKIWNQLPFDILPFLEPENNSSHCIL
jgi:hypothetical protein